MEGDPNPVEAYLNSGGNPARFLTANEIAILNRPSAFDAGHTLVHLAIRLAKTLPQMNYYVYIYF